MNLDHLPHPSGSLKFISFFFFHSWLVLLPFSAATQSVLRLRVGKMVLWSYLLGCAGPALTSACAMTYKDPFVLPMNAAQRRDAKSAKIALAQVRACPGN